MEEHKGSKFMLKLYHGTELVGLISNPSVDDMSWRVGTIELTQAAEKYKELFAFFTDEEQNMSVEPPFPRELLESWAIEDEAGERNLIDIPGVYDDGEVFWRYF